jgi:hypothetical protein
VEWKKLMVVGVLALALLGASTQTASAQKQGGYHDTRAADFAVVAEEYAILTFTNAVATGKPHQMNLAYDVFVLAYYGAIAINGAGADGGTPFFSINGFDQSASSGYTSPGSSEYQADFTTGVQFLSVCESNALSLYGLTGDPVAYFTYVFCLNAATAGNLAIQNND